MNLDTDPRTTLDKDNEDSFKWHVVDVDKVLHFLGPFGRYQVIQLFLMAVLITNLSHPILSAMFTGKHVDVSCTNQNTTDMDFNTSSKVPPRYEEAINKNRSLIKQAPCNLNQYDGDPGTSFIAEWDLVCEKETLGQLPQIMVMVGMGVGAVTFPHLGDRYGRKKLVIGTSLCQILVMSLQVFVQQFELFVLLKLLGGALQMGTLVPLNTMTMEVLPIQNNSFASLLQTVMWSMSICIVGLIGYVFQDYTWRQLQLAYTLSMLPALLACCFLDEPLRWLLDNSKTKEAEHILRKACKTNRKDYNKLTSTYDMISKKDEASLITQDEKQPDSRIDVNVLKNKNIWRITLVLCYAWMICSLTYYGLTLMSTTVAGDPYINYTLTALAEIPSGFFIYYTMQIYGRKRSAIGFQFVSASALLLVVLVIQLTTATGISTIIQTLFTLIGKCFNSGVFSILWIYTSELYPTNLRNIGVGLASAAARVGASISPLFTILARRVQWAPGALFGLGSFISIFLMMLIPETRWSELPRNVEDVDKWFKKKKNVSIPLNENV